MIPDESQLVKAVMQQSPISIYNPNAKSAQAFGELAQALENNTLEPMQVRRGMAGFFASMVRGRGQI